MSKSSEMIERLRAEDVTLEARIQRLETEAGHKSLGIRQYRCQRIGQLRQRHYTLRDRVRRIEAHAHEWDAIRPQAERLYLELREAQVVADRTFH